MSCKYVIERHPHGWLICAATGQRGIPANALDECMPLFPRHSGGAVFDAGIAHHYAAMPREGVVVFAVTTVDGATLWRNEIAEGLKNLDPEYKWWYGCDVGTSSAAMFAILTRSSSLSATAYEYGRSSCPHDADDLGRCKRLLDVRPEWKTRLNEVAAAYPETAWPFIVERWDVLMVAPPKVQTSMLSECHHAARMKQ